MKDRIVATLVGGPVRAVLAGALALTAIVWWLGWFRPAIAAVLVLAWTVWDARQWRPW